MRRAGSLWLMGSLITALAVLPAAAGPKGPGEAKGPKVVDQPAGQVFCPRATLIAGNVIIPGGQCFVLSVLRNPSGTFLAFVPPSAHIPRGQLVRLNTPAGAKRMGRMFLVPISPAAHLVPVNTMTLVTTRIEDFGPRIGINLVGMPGFTPPVIFTVRP